ncbi:DUF1715-domain-containing protein [Russula emetica]|nr:DUF1715-domain-containing protein [Russula emetica]
MIPPSTVHTDTDTQDFDLEQLVHLEQTFYTAGYEDGYAHGRLHGLIEGRALGAEKGFELWEELGFYEGAARLWTAVFSTDSSGTDARGAHHASALLSLIDRFPRKNPRPDDEGVDMSAQLRLIRSRYKVMCASLGVRARLQPAAPLSVRSSETGPGPGVASGGEEAIALAPGGRDLDDADADAEKKRQRQKTIWPLTAPPTSPSAQDLSF